METRVRPSVSEPTKRRHSGGFIRAIGGLFKRRSSDANGLSAPSDSESSQRSTSRWSRFSLRHSLPEAPMEMEAVAAPETAPIRENDSVSTPSPSPHPEEPPAKKAKKAEKPKKEKKEKKPNPPSQKSKPSPTDTPELLLAAESESGDEYGAEPARLSFLFFGGSDNESTFVPDLRPSDLDDLHENDLRPSLQAKMPQFFSPPVVEHMRRSSILPDPRDVIKDRGECGDKGV
ncbi:hypothetical protein BBJ29_007477 [Phytophthora kernoviae]|uniref:Uncharacterized protein n=1 Tax=Phytophthora kernoviae TaxID=325452 RepID=A0A3F2RE55_9STRA|nr:hypothetical protein BBP00_00008905 [Phytophthora kernoviae]RLN55535.1 hypothetical protein BBJ29_007477 [Phytophthora kernoviae]